MRKRESFGSARYWLEGHEITMERYLEKYYPDHDWPLITYFFKENPIQARVILSDYKKSNEQKLKTIIDIFLDGKSKIVYIVGARGSGKTATAFMIAEESYRATQKKIYYVGIGVNKDFLPRWCVGVNAFEDIPHGSIGIIDESGVQFSAREFYNKGNIDMTKFIAVARHKDLSLIFLTQHTGISDINIQRLRDLVIWKRSNDYSLAEKGTQRSKEHQFWKKVRNMMAPRSMKECLFEYPAYRRFIHFCHNLPECWTEELSKSWKERTFKRDISEQSGRYVNKDGFIVKKGGTIIEKMKTKIPQKIIIGE